MNVSVKTAWIGYEKAPAIHANQFIVQTTPQGEIMIGIGSITPPPVFGEPEQIKKQLEGLPFVPINMVSKISVTKEHLDQMIKVLEDARSKINKVSQ